MKKKIKIAVQYFVLIVVSLISVFPIYWMAVSATNKSVDVTNGTLLPGMNLFNNFKTLIDNYNLGRAMWNSLSYSLTLTLAALVICSIAGYGFEIYHDKGKDFLMSCLLLAMMVPFASIIIPLFKMFSSMKMLDSVLGFVLPIVSTPFLILMFRQAARSFPHDIIEAARMEGLGEVGIFFKMFIPTMKSTYAAAMTITFMNAWNSYLWPKIIMLTPGSETMPMLVANMQSGYLVDYGMLMLSVLICSVPTIIVFFFLQKFFAEGITGAVK